MCEAVPAVTPENDLYIKCKVVLHAQKREKAPVIAISTNQAIFQYLKSVAAQAAPSRQSSTVCMVLRWLAASDTEGSRLRK
eukprot:6186168-Pleurochrysis_carterae.AAC.1